MSEASANWMLIRPTYADAAGDRLGRLPDPVDLLAAERDRRQGAGGVAGVDAGLLDVLHHAAEEELLAVEERVHVDLDRVVEEPVDEHRVLRADLGGPHDVALERGVVVHDLHAAAAEDVGRPHQHRVADLVGDLLGVGERRGHARTSARAARPRARTRPNAPRSSARWMAAGEVPTMGTPASSRPCASPSGVCPPSWQITPAIGPAFDSACTISSTSSSVSGSK